MNKRPLLLILLTMAAPAFGQRSTEAEHTCYAKDGHADQRQCLDDWAKRSEQQLESQEATTRSAILRADQDKDDIDRVVAAFDKAVAEYRQYRTTQCEFVGALAFSGNAQADRRLLCEVELNTARIQYLRVDLKNVV